MGAILKGLQAILIALGIIAVIGSGVILYYNMIKPEGTGSAILIETEPSDNTILVNTLTTGDEEALNRETAAETDETESTESETDESSVANAADGSHRHDYRPSILKDATCSEAGQMLYKCSCGDYYVEPIAPLDHTEGDWITVKEATTGETGLRQKSCTVCGRMLHEETIPMLAKAANETAETEATETHIHSYKYEISEEPTCTENGEKKYTCTECSSSYVVSIPATNHPSRQTIRTAGTCGNPGTVVCSCSICGAVISTDTLTYDHDYGDWTVTKEATTSSKGTKSRTCKVCGKVDTKSIPRL